MLSLFILYGMILEAAGVFQSESCDMTLTSVFVNFVNFLSHFCDLTVFLKVFFFFTLCVCGCSAFSVYEPFRNKKSTYVYPIAHHFCLCCIYIYMIKN